MAFKEHIEFEDFVEKILKLIKKGKRFFSVYILF